MKQNSFWTIALALIAGIVVGSLDMTMGYAPLPHITVLVGAAILSAFNVKQAWLIAFILGGSILIAHGIAGIVGITPPYVIKNLADILRPIALAIGGAFIGVKTSINMAKPQIDNYSEEAKL